MVWLSGEETVRFSEQIMSADKYRRMFSRQMEAIVYISFARSITKSLERCIGR